MAFPHPTSGDKPERILLPQPPEARNRRELPLLATAAPVLASLVMWAVTGSAFALVFAFLGPVVAVGSLLDDGRQFRRIAKSEARRFSADVEVALCAIEKAHERERAVLLESVLEPHRALENSLGNVEWWRQEWNAPIPVCLGVGSIPSGLELEPSAALASPTVTDGYAGLRAAAETLDNAPVLVDARGGIAIVGPPVAASALARSVVVQLALGLSPDSSVLSTSVRSPSAAATDATRAFDWVRDLPHPVTHLDEGGDRIVFSPAGVGPSSRVNHVVCAVVPEGGRPPRSCRVLVRLTEGGGAAVERNPSGLPIPAFRPRFTSDQEARTLAAHAAERAAAAGIISSAGALPSSADLSRLHPARARAGALPAVFSVDADGPVEIDLVRDGPHAVVGGMTGSGKSELLVSWVVALAKASSPSEVNFLLVDFKGGSSFAAVSRLQHTAGLITDLDQLAAERALSSLRAELRHRERVLAAAGARAIDELTGAWRMPRVVIVVDEFAVVASEFPELQTLFADLASRGRSLGIHLILCTQRPAGVVRDAVLANCSLRLSLRVNNPADSVAVVGTPGAAELAAHPVGRCLVSIGGAPAVTLQVALTTLDEVTELAGRYSADSDPVRRPWCEPLPAVVPLDAVIAGCSGPGLPFGLLDVPEEQTQPPAVYEPASDGNLMVVGARGTGKSGTLTTLQEAGRMRSITTVRIPSDVEGAWDAVVAAVTELGTEKGRNVLYLLDDLDALIGKFGHDHQLEFADLLVRLMREGGRTVLSVGRVTSTVQAVLAQCDSRLILRMQNRQEHVLAGADPALYSSELLPGAGTWRGHRVQVAAASPEGPMSPIGLNRRRSQWPLHEQGFALVTPSAAATAARILAADTQAVAPGIVTLPVPADQTLTVTAESSPGPRVLAGSPADWQAQWGLFAVARSSGPVVFVGCSVAEFRALVGTRRLPPPLGPTPGAAWILERDGRIIRSQLP